MDAETKGHFKNMKHHWEEIIISYSYFWISLLCFGRTHQRFENTGDPSEWRLRLREVWPKLCEVLSVIGNDIKW